MIDSIACETGTWRFVPPKGSKERGAQIDLLFDRNDAIITLCELKHCDKEFVIDKKYAAELEQKIAVFRKKTKTKKHVFIAMITTHGVARNDHYKRLVKWISDKVEACFPRFFNILGFLSDRRRK